MFDKTTKIPIYINPDKAEALSEVAEEARRLQILEPETVAFLYKQEPELLDRISRIARLAPMLRKTKSRLSL